MGEGIILDDEFLDIDGQPINDLEKIDGEIKEFTKELKIEITEEDKAIYSAPVSAIKKKPGRKAKIDVPTPGELNQMSDDEVEKAAPSMGDQIKSLYYEFNSFLVNKTDIKPDTGVKTTIPIGIDVLDAIMGGGFAIGTMAMVIGTSGGGKSMLVIQAAANAQKIYKGNILIMYLDSEEATTTARMASLGVRHPTLQPYNDITIEKVFRSLEGVCLYKEMKNIIEQPSIVVWDSIANTLSEKERQEEDINKSIGYKARLLTVLIPKYVAKLSAYNICLIAVNQLRDNIQIGPYQAPKDLNFMRQGKTIPGGNATKFNAFHIIDSKIKGVVDPGKFGFDGIVVEMKCIKNKLFPPNIPVQLAGHFVTGFNNFWTNYMFLIEHKRIIPGGGWNTITSMPAKRFRTIDAKDMFHNNPEFKQAFNEAVQETIKIEILEKNNPFIFENDDEDDDKND